MTPSTRDSVQAVGASGGHSDCPGYPHDPLWDALREVEDPEMGISLVDMGMIVDARREDATAVIQLTYTAMGCPATEMIESDIHRRLLRVPGIESVVIDVVWEPVWTKARLTDDGRDALLLLGVSV
ncbi:MAG TPA: metal-sulfur cluster assembly factor [Ktedonobacterales bacterium]|nr:metal-sulfur cluster assembly factor [Ktedonobacterales bacterium]